MKAYILYRPRSEFARIVEEYVHEFKRVRGQDIELLDLDTREGTAKATLYGIVQNPTLIVLREDGQLAQAWEGPQLPAMNDLSGYLSA